MREVQASDAKAHLPQVLDDVEHGESVVITRPGRPIARIVPGAHRRQADCTSRPPRETEMRTCPARELASDRLSSVSK